MPQDFHWIRRLVDASTRILAWLLLALSLATCAIVVDLWWKTRQDTYMLMTGLPQPKNLTEEAQYLREKLEAYEKRADDLQKLISLLLGLATIYGIALGLSAYFGLQQTIQQAQQSAAELKEMREDARKKAEEVVLEIRKEFPLFGYMDGAMRRIMDHLIQLLPVLDWSEEIYRNLSPQSKQEILFFEKTVAAFEFFDLRAFRHTASQIYHGLGNFYGLKYATEIREGKPLSEDLDRSRFYLGRALSEDDQNVGALNDRGYLALELESPNDLPMARHFFEKSLRIDSGQQRARYNLALVEHRQGKFAASEKLLTEALALEKWQENLPPRHRSSLHYNRACARVRLAEFTSEADRGSKLLRQAMEDLRAVFLPGEPRYERLGETFREDLKQGGDLYSLSITEPYSQELKVLGASDTVSGES